MEEYIYELTSESTGNVFRVKSKTEKTEDEIRALAKEHKFEVKPVVVEELEMLQAVNGIDIQKLKEEWDRKGAIDVFEAGERQNKWDIVPFSFSSVIREVEANSAIKRLQEDDYQDGYQKQKDEETYKQYALNKAEESYRGYTFAGQLYYGITESFAFMAEYALLGGVVAPLKAGARKGISAGLRPLAKVATNKTAAKIALKAGGTLAEAGGRTILMPHRYIAKAGERQITHAMAITDKGIYLLKESDESPMKSLFFALGQTGIDNLTESFGDVLFKPVGRWANKGLMRYLSDDAAKAIYRVGKRLSPKGSVIDFFRKAGWNGMAEEYLEERSADILNILAGLNEEDKPLFIKYMGAIFPDTERALLDVGVISFFGGASFTGQKFVDYMQRKGLSKKEIEILDNGLTETQKEEAVSKFEKAEADLVKKAYNKEQLTENEKEQLDLLYNQYVEDGLIDDVDTTPEDKAEAIVDVNTEQARVMTEEETVDPLIEEAKKYKTAEEWVASHNLFHGTPSEIEGGKLKFGAGKQLKKGGYMGGHFLTDKEQAAQAFQFGGQIYQAKIDDNKIFDVNKNKKIFKNFIGKKYRNSDGEMETFTKNHYDFMFPDGENADWSTVYADVVEYLTKEKGYIGMKIDEYAGGVDAMTYQIWEDEIPIYTKQQLTDIWKQAQDSAVENIFKTDDEATPLAVTNYQEAKELAKRFGGKTVRVGNEQVWYIESKQTKDEFLPENYTDIWNEANAQKAEKKPTEEQKEPTIISNIKEKLDKIKEKKDEKIKNYQKETVTESLYTRLKNRLKDIQSGIKIGRNITIKEARNVKKELISMLKDMRINTDLKNKIYKKLSSKITTQKDLEKKLPELLNVASEIVRNYEDRVMRAKAIKKITKKYKKPENVVDVKYQEKIEKVKAKLGGTKTKMKKKLKDMTTKDLIKLANAISLATEQGKKLLRSKKDQQNMASEIMRAVLIKEAGGDIAMPPYGSKEYKKRTKAGIFKKIDIAATRPIQLIRKIFGKVGEKIFYDSIDIASTTKATRKFSRINKLKESFKKNKINKFTLGKSHTIDKVTFNLNNMLRMYLSTKDSQSYDAIINGNKISETTFNKFMDLLKKEYPNYIKFADDVQDIVSKEYDSIRDVMQNVYNLTLGKVANYFPIFRQFTGEVEPEGYENNGADIALEHVSRGGVDYSSIEKGFAIKRQDIDAQNQMPVSLDFLGDAYRAIESQEHLISFAHLQKMFNSLKYDNEIKNTVVANHNQAAWDSFNSYLKSVIDPRIRKQDLGFISSKMAGMRQALANSYLAFNTVTALKQLPSVLYGLRYTDIGTLSHSVYKVLSSKKYRQSLYDKAPQLLNRFMTRDLDEFMAENTKLSDNDIIRALSIAQDVVGKKAFSLIMNMDRLAVLSVYDAVYNKAIKTHSAIEAADIANKAVIETQPQGAMKDLPELYRTNNEFLRMAVMFTNQLNQIYNLMRFSVPSDIQNKDYGKAMATISSIMVSSFIIYLASHGGKMPDDEDELVGAWIDALFGSFISSVPLLGNYTMAMIRGYSPSISPLEGVASSIKHTVNNFKNEKYLEGSLEGLTNAAILAGVKIPTTATRKLIKGLIDLSEGETDDIRRLIYSKTALFE